MKTRSKAVGASSAELAQLFDCSARQVENLARDGIAVRLGRGRYNAALSTRNYVRHLRDQAGGRLGFNAKVDPVVANVRLRTAQAELTELKIKQEQGELIPVEEVRTTWAAIMRTVRQFVMALPNQIAFEVPTLTVHDRKAIDRLCREGLEDCAMARGFEITPADRSATGELNDAP